MSETIDLQDPAQVHEAVVQDRLDELRAEFYVLAINWNYVRDHHRTGEQISPGYGPCLCPNCSNKTDALLYSVQNFEAAFFCDQCFDAAHEDEICEELSKEMERDFS
jgi:hypothetical protein